MPDETPEMIEAQAELERVAAEAKALAAEQQSLALAPTTGGALQDPEELRGKMEELRAAVQAKTEEVREAHERVSAELERQMDAKREELQRMSDAAEAALEPLEKVVKVMKEGIWTLSLYMGLRERIVPVRAGKPADKLEPIVIRQMVLAMDEETGLFADEGGITADDAEAFDQWLAADMANVEQIVPEAKGVVACVPRWTSRKERDPWSSDPKDRETHFIIRNGEQVYRVTADFHAGDVLVPRADEFVKYFFAEQHDWDTHERKRVAIKPGTREYDRAMEESDARGRHYLRIGLILQGLVDRTDVFAPLHPGGINMLTDPSDRSEKVRIVTDAEGGLEAGGPSFVEWHQSINQELRVGMRVVGAFGGRLYEGDAYGWDEGSEELRDERLFPRGFRTKRPNSGVPYMIEDRRDDGGLVIRYERDDEVWDPNITTPVPGRPGWVYRGEHRKAKRRASCVLYKSDAFILPYDLVDSQTLERFLRNRRDRRDYKRLWPLLTGVMRAKRAEELAEEPFLEMLRGVCARDNGEMPSTEEARELARWFKLKNRYHRPLVFAELIDVEKPTPGGRKKRGRGNRETEEALLVDEQQGDMALAVRMIVAEHKRRVADRRRPINAEVVAKLRKAHPAAVVVARIRRGGYLVLDPAEPTVDVFVHEHEYTAKGELRETREWRTVGTDRPTRWTIAYEHPRWQQWDLAATARDHLTLPERDAIVEKIVRQAERAGRRLMLVSYRADDKTFVEWSQHEFLEVDEEHALTGEHSKPDYHAAYREWSRKGDGTVALDQWSSWRGSTWSEGKVGDKPWEGHYAKRAVGVKLHEDPAAFDAFVEERKQWRRHMEQWEEMRQLVRRTHDVLAEAWRAPRVAEDQARWLERGGSMDEWEAERARAEELRYPHGRSSWRMREDALGHVIDLIVEAGVNPDGLTVAEMRDHAVEHLGLDLEEWLAGGHFRDAIPEEMLGVRVDLSLDDDDDEEYEDDDDLDAEADAADAEEDLERERQRERDGVIVELDDGIDVLEPEPDEPDVPDVFDNLRDSIHGAFGKRD